MTAANSAGGSGEPSGGGAGAQPAGNGHLVSGMVMIDDDLGMTGEALPPTTGLASSRLVRHSQTALVGLFSALLTYCQMHRLSQKRLLSLGNF